MDNNRKEAAGCFKALPELINSRKWNEVVREVHISYLYYDDL